MKKWNYSEVLFQDLFHCWEAFKNVLLCWKLVVQQGSCPQFFMTHIKYLFLLWVILVFEGRSWDQIYKKTDQWCPVRKMQRNTGTPHSINKSHDSSSAKGQEGRRWSWTSWKIGWGGWCGEGVECQSGWISLWLREILRPRVQPQASRLVRDLEPHSCLHT